MTSTGRKDSILHVHTWTQKICSFWFQLIVLPPAVANLAVPIVVLPIAMPLHAKEFPHIELPICIGQGANFGLIVLKLPLKHLSSARDVVSFDLLQLFIRHTFECVSIAILYESLTHHYLIIPVSSNSHHTWFQVALTLSFASLPVAYEFGTVGFYDEPFPMPSILLPAAWIYLTRGVPTSTLPVPFIHSKLSLIPGLAF